MSGARSVVAFVPTVIDGEPVAETCARELQKLIDQNERDGWSFVRLERVTTDIVPDGCLFSMIGWLLPGLFPTTVTTVQVAVFEWREDLA